MAIFVRLPAVVNTLAKTVLGTNPVADTSMSAIFTTHCQPYTYCARARAHAHTTHTHTYARARTRNARMRNRAACQYSR